MNVLTTLTVRDDTFYIIKNGDYYCAVNTKDVKDGKTTRKLNGLQMFANKSIDRCIEEVRFATEVNYRMSQGMTFEDAVNDVCKAFKY